jgi:hypothetical protein
MNWELVGGLATVFVIWSFTMTDERKIRIINIIGAAIFVVYGFAINAISTGVLNAILVLVHLYYLTRDKNK